MSSHDSLRLSLVLVSFSLIHCSRVDFSEAPIDSSSALGLGDRQALVYGADEQDRRLLAEKIAGYAAPGFSEIFANWRRIAGAKLYAKVSDIKVSSQPHSYCYTKILATGYWQETTHPSTGAVVKPSADKDCIAQPWFSALSWSLTGGRLAHASNSGNFNGFISGVKFDNYVSQAVVTSASTDDDEIAMIMAVAVDGSGRIHSLAAARSQGGYTSDLGVPGTSRNWRVSYRINNVLTKTYGERAIDIVHKSKGSSVDGNGEGDTRGWNGRSSLIRIEREGDVLRAYTSMWGTSTSAVASLPVVPASKIELDLGREPALAVFRGAQYVGYGMQSQPLTQFYGMSFTTRSNAQFVYDLVNDWVYEQQPDGTYKRRADLVASVELGFPRRIANVETQKEYLLRGAKDFELIHR